MFIYHHGWVWKVLLSLAHFFTVSVRWKMESKRGLILNQFVWLVKFVVEAALGFKYLKGSNFRGNLISRLVKLFFSREFNFAVHRFLKNSREFNFTVCILRKLTNYTRIWNIKHTEWKRALREAFNGVFLGVGWLYFLKV